MLTGGDRRRASAKVARTRRSARAEITEVKGAERPTRPEQAGEYCSQ